MRVDRRTCLGAWTASSLNADYDQEMFAKLTVSQRVSSEKNTPMIGCSQLIALHTYEIKVLL